MSIEIDRLTVHYGGALALSSVTLEVSQGSIVAVLGPNGAGKSTLVRCIAGLKHATSGQILLNGLRIDGFSPRRTFAMGVASVPEGRRLFPRMTVLENLAVGSDLRQDKAGIRQSLDEVFSYFPVLKSRVNQQAGTLSGGEQQMLAIARALMSAPKYLLLDEPSLGLAPLLIEELLLVLKGLSKSGVGILLAEQNALQALKIAETAYFFQTGTIVLSGKAEAVRDDEMVKKSYLGDIIPDRYAVR